MHKIFFTRVVPRLFWVCALFLPLSQPVLADPSLADPVLFQNSGNVIPAPIFEVLSDADGLSQNTINCIFQDSIGFIWIGTQDGLNRYDGYEFRVFRHDSHDPNSLSSNLIWDITEDERGDLWIATDNGLNWMDRVTGSIIRFLHNPQDPGSLSDNTVSRVFWDSTDNLWVGTLGGGLDRFDLQTLSFDHFRINPDDSGSISSNYIGDLLEDDSGRLWIGTWNGLDVLDRETGVFSHFRNDPDDPLSLSGNVIRSLELDSEGFLWIGTAGSGLDRLDMDRSRFRHYRSSRINEFSLSNNTIWDLLLDSSGNLWVATDDGLNYFSRTTDSFRRFQFDNQNPNDPQSLSNPVAYAVFEDRSGVFWVGTGGGGINCFNTASHRFGYLGYLPNSPYGLSSNLVYSFTESMNGHVWIGTDEGLDELFPNSGRLNHHLGNEDFSESILSILADTAGSLWLGTVSGLYRYDIEKEEFIFFTSLFSGEDYEDYASDGYSRIIIGTPPRLQNPSQFSSASPLTFPILALVEDQDGFLWVGTSGRGLIRIDQDRNAWERVTTGITEDEANNLIVTAMLIDDRGDLWVGTESNGLIFRDQMSGEFTYYSTEPGNDDSLSSNSITSLAQSGNGDIWIGTSEGLNCLVPSTGILNQFSTEEGLPANSIKGILQDSSGSLWISTDRGISRFVSSIGTFLNFDLNDGLQSNEFHGGAALLGTDGTIYFGGVNGISYFSPEDIALNTYIPPVVITALTQGGENLEDGSFAETQEVVTLTWPRNYFEFEFSALSYLQNDENQYAFRLEGLESEWNQTGTRRYGRYTNLSGGTYTLHIIASNNDDVWNNEGTSLMIRVIPPLWENSWIQILVIGLLGGAIFTGYRLNVRKVQTNNILLSKRVEERTREIERRRMVAEGLRDVLALLNSSCSMEESLTFIACQINQLIPVSIILLVQEGSSDEPIILHCDDQQSSISKSKLKDSQKLFPAELGKWAKDVIWQDHAVLMHGLFPETVSGTNPYQSVLLLPVAQGGERLSGLILLFKEKRDFNQDELDNLKVFAEQAALAIGNSRLRANAEELAVLSERNRLARELHDAVTQSLFSASLIAEALPNAWISDQSEGAKLVDDLRRLNRSALAEMRNLLLELRPAAIADSDLNVLLKQLGEAAIGRMTAELELNLNLDGRLPSDVHLTFYRVAQEAITNVIKHSMAKKLKISLTSLPADDFASNAERDMIISLEIMDNGCGFNARNISSEHFGLVNLRDRAQSINADLQILSSQDEGTIVRIIWRGKVEHDGTRLNPGGGGG